MKGNSKKMTVFLSVTAIAIFGVLAMASAGDRDDYHGGIIGEYAIIGSGACLFAAGGLSDSIHFTPVSPAGSTVGPNTWEGVYKFYRDGHGEFDSLNRFADTTPSAGLGHVSWNFKYEVHQGKISLYDIGNYVGEYLYGPLACSPFSKLTGVSFSPNSYEGLISPDGNTLLVSFGVPMEIIPPFPGLVIVCNGVQQGFKCGGKCPDLVIPPAPTCP